MAIGVFGLKKVYKKQVENINNGNFNSWVEDYSHGYVITGNELGSGNTGTIVRYFYDTDLSVNLPPGSSVPATQGLNDNATAFNYDYAFVSGGSSPASNTISRLDFSLDTFSVPGTNLPTNVDKHSGISRVSEGYGYFIGGQNPALVAPRNISTITRLDFANETLSPMPNLPAFIINSGAFDGTTYGYVGGGDTPTPTTINTIYRLDFSNNTLSISPSSKNFIAVRSNFVSLQSPLYGYAAAGSPNLSSIERLDFSSETVSSLSAITSASGSDGGGFSSIVSGFMMGINNTTNLTRLDFSTELVSSPLVFGTNNKYRERFSSASCRHKRFNNNTGTYQYSNRGNNNTIDKVSFQTGTWSSNITNLPGQKADIQGASTNEFGYFFGGSTGTGNTSEITRLDFTTEILTTGKKNDKAANNAFYLPSTAALTLQAVTQTNSYAYIAGGTNPDTNAILRMDFSTENITQEAQFPGNVSSLVATKSPTNAYFALNSTSKVYRLNFSSETVSTLPNYPFANNDTQGAASKGPTYGYFMGGKNPAATPTSISYVYRFDFSDETFSLIPTRFNAGTKSGGFSYNNLYAYFNAFGSGDSTVQRMDFGTETITTETPSPANRPKSAAFTNTNN